MTDWPNTSTNEVSSFLDVIIPMGFHRLFRISNYWNAEEYSRLPLLQKHMPLIRLWDLWCNIQYISWTINLTDIYIMYDVKCKGIKVQIT